MNIQQHADEALDTLATSRTQFTDPFMVAKVVTHIKAVLAAFEFKPLSELPKCDGLFLIQRLNGSQERMFYGRGKKAGFVDTLGDPENPVAGWRELI